MGSQLKRLKRKALPPFRCPGCGLRLVVEPGETDGAAVTHYHHEEPMCPVFLEVMAAEGAELTGGFFVEPDGAGGVSRVPFNVQRHT